VSRVPGSAAPSPLSHRREDQFRRPVMSRPRRPMSSRAPRNILVYGSLEVGQVVRDLAILCGDAFAGFIDDLNRRDEVVGTWDEVLGTWDEVTRSHARRSHAVAMAVGYRHMRERGALHERVRAQGYAMPALIHPRAYVREPAAVGEGAIIMAGAIVDMGVRIDALAVVWPSAPIIHDCRIGAHTLVSPRATICGSTVVGEDCFIGAGATVVDHRNVPAGTFVKAGSVYAGAK